MTSALAASLSAEERALARFLRDEVLSALERTRGDERRVDAYLALQKALRLDDTDGSVRVLQHFLPGLLRAIHDDLHHATVLDVVNIALRTLSYFMYHKSLAASFADAQVEGFLTDIMSRMTATQDEAIYKVCLWCLSMQNFDMTRLDFLPRIVEALVLAILNPFKSRKIAVEALKGLHLMILKFKPLMAGQATTLRLWFRPVASRLSSSDKTTREQAALVLLEAADFSRSHTWGTDFENEISASLVEYAMPTMQAHMTHERCHDALTVWKIVVILMRRKFASDLGLLGDLLAVPEQLMRHEDANVRLQSIEAWQHLLHVFRQSKDWVFKRPALMVLIRPILLCLEQETAFNVLHATVATWRVVVAAIVEDFNAYCQTQELTDEAIQQNAKKWKRWVDEAVKKVLVVAMEQERNQADGVLQANYAGVHDVIQTTVREMFSTVAATNEEDATASNVPASSGGSSTTTANSSAASEQQSRRQKKPTVDLSELDDELLQHSSASASLSLKSRPSPIPSCPPMTKHLVGLALVLPDVSKVVDMLAQTARNASIGKSAREQRFADLGLYVWEKFCTRLKLAASVPAVDQVIDKMRLRLVRLCLDFSWGLSSSPGSATGSLDSQASALIPSLQTDSVMTAADLINGSTRSADQGSIAFQWQLRLLRHVIGLAKSPEELSGLLQHPKSKISQHLLTRVDRIVEPHDVYKGWVAKWDKSTDSGDHATELINFSAKTATGLCVLLYLVLRLAVVFDDLIAIANSASTEILWEVVSLYEEIVAAVADSVDRSQETNETAVKFRRVVVNSSRAAKALLERDNDVPSEASGLGQLLKASDRLVTLSEESQNNAEVLLQLKRSPAKETPPVNRVSSPTRISPVQSTRDEPNSAVSTTSDGVTSPCLLQAQTNRSADQQTTSPPPRPEASDDSTPALQTPTHPRKSAIKQTPTPSRTFTSTPSRTVTPSDATPSAAIFPDLVGSSEPISLLLKSFPLVFRQFIAFYKIETVGHLSALTVDQVQKFGGKDNVATVRKVLNDFQTRRARSRFPASVNSPFRPPTHPAPLRSPTPLPSPSPRRILKRPTGSPSRLPVTPLPFESPQRKRARRSLTELSEAIDQAEASNAGQESHTPGSEQRVKFKLETRDGETRITRPGTDSQGVEVLDPDEPRESVHGRIQTYSLKFNQHLQRSLHYIEKIMAEEESLQSDVSLSEATNQLEFMVGEINTARDLVLRINSHLVQAAERVQQRSERARASGESPSRK